MSSQEIKRQISELASKAAPVFQRPEFQNFAVWAGIFGPLSCSKPAAKCPVDVVIFYNPKISEYKVWSGYNEDPFECDDPDEPRLMQVWGRKVHIVRIFEGTLYDTDDIEGIFQGQTIYGDFKNQAFQSLRSSCYRRLEELLKRVNECRGIANLGKKPDGSMVSKPLMDISV
jgi:hypothetical protein